MANPNILRYAIVLIAVVALIAITPFLKKTAFAVYNIEDESYVLLNSPQDNAWINRSTIELSCTAFSQSLERLELYHNIGQDFGFGGSNTTDAISGEPYSFNVEAGDGMYEWNCKAVSGSQDIFAETNNTLVIDTSAPVISIVSPENGTIASNNSLLIAWTVNDNLDTLLSCKIIVDGIAVENIEADAGQQNSLIIQTADGNHEWQIECVDEAGNSASSETRSITITEGPIISTYPEESGELLAKNLAFNFVITLSEAGTISYAYNDINATACTDCKTANLALKAINFGQQQVIVYAESGSEKSRKETRFALELDTDLDGVKDSEDEDKDNDGLSNNIDFLTGNNSNLNTNIDSLYLEVDGSPNLNQEFYGVKNIVLKDNSLEYVKVKYNFSKELELGKVEIYKQSSGERQTMIRGIDANEITLYVDAQPGSAKNHVCAKKFEISAFSDISVYCNGSSEYYVPCNGIAKEGITCNIDSNRFKVEGKVFAAREQCSENWTTDEWSKCINGLKTRNVTDTNNCGTYFNKPYETKKCVGIIEENEETEENSGAGDSNLNAQSADIKTKHFRILSPTQVEYMQIDDALFAIKQIAIKTKKPAENVKLTIKQLAQNPAEQKDFIEYQYFEITATNLSNADIEDIKITFAVNASWLKEKNISKSSVSLYRYSNAWEKLETEQIGDKPQQAIYQAISKGFSYFAIGAEKEQEGVKITLGENDKKTDSEQKQGLTVIPPAKSGFEKVTGKFRESVVSSMPVYIALLILIIITFFSFRYSFKQRLRKINK